VVVNGQQQAGRCISRSLVWPSPAVAVSVLVGCASAAGRVSSTPVATATRPAFAATSPCFVADTAARTRDTLYVIGFDPDNADVHATDCEGRAIPAGDPPVMVTQAPPLGADLRDAIDGGLTASGSPRPDVVITRDPALLAYVAASPDYFISTLPWSRTYVLLGFSGDSVPSESERDALARNAVNADTRGAVQPYEWLTNPSCMATHPILSGSPRALVAYAAGDAIARQLAERVVALTSSRPRPSWLSAAPAQALRIAPVAADSIPGVLAEGRAAVGVIALRRDRAATCGTPDAPISSRAIPLIDSRAHVIVRRGSGAAFIIGSDGTLHFLRRGSR
jgi:hypothetical protein